LYRFATESDKQLMSARLLRSNPQYERSVLLVHQFTEGWFHRPSTRRQQLAYKTHLLCWRACDSRKSRSA